MQEILKDPSLNEKRIVVRQFASNEYRTTFKELHKLAIRNIIIDVRHENILTVLRHAQQVDMLSAYHNYFFISLDVHTVDLEEFQYSGLNISGFSLIDFNSKDFMRILSKFQKDSKAQYWNDESTSPQFENIYRMVSSNNFTVSLTDNFHFDSSFENRSVSCFLCMNVPN